MSSLEPSAGESVTGQALFQWRDWAIQQAKAKGVDPYEVDWLLQGVSELGNTALRLGTFRTQSQIALRFSLTELTEKWRQRMHERVPVQYLVGETPWRDLMLTVTPAVLIPRPETELMIELVQQRVQHSPRRAELEMGTWVDMGTGSGAIAIALAKALPKATVLAVDMSADALAVAQHNAIRNGVQNRIQFFQGSWFEPLAPTVRLAGVVTNPPYIPSETVKTLDPEVQHEPDGALDGGADGLSDIRTLAQQARTYLQAGGLWITELMLGQADGVKALLTELAYQQVEHHPDLAGIERFVSGYYS